MGKVENQVKRRQQELQQITDDFIEMLKWYIKECRKLDVEVAEAKNNLTEAFNSRIAELKQRAEENKDENKCRI